VIDEDRAESCSFARSQQRITLAILATRRVCERARSGHCARRRW